MPSVPRRLAGAVAAAAVSSAGVMVPIALILLFLDPQGDASTFWAIAMLSLAAFAVALGHALLLGLPLYAFLGLRRSPSLATTLVASFAIGALPLSLAVILLTSNQGDVSAWSNGVPTVIDGEPTLRFYLEVLPLTGFLGLIGMAGGLAFWLVAGRPVRVECEPPLEVAVPRGAVGRSEQA